jgi:hypothetical protein
MGQVNVNPPGSDRGGDSAAAAGINLITVLVVLAVVVALLWFIFTGPLQSLTSGPRDVNVDVNVPAQQQPAAPPAKTEPAPSKP